MHAQEAVKAFAEITLIRLREFAFEVPTDLGEEALQVQ
jgi:hypothetical protein